MDTLQSNGIADKVREFQGDSIAPAQFYDVLGRKEREYHSLCQLGLFEELTEKEVLRIAQLRKEILTLRAAFRQSVNEN